MATCPNCRTRWDDSVRVCPEDGTALSATASVPPSVPSSGHGAASSGSWRCEPLPISRFPLGLGPFRVRGLAYTTALDYVDKRLPGGRAALLAALGSDDPYAPYFDQLFVVTGGYDISPLVRLYLGIAQLKKVDVTSFIEQRSRWSGRSDVEGVWRPVLKKGSPEAMTERLRFAFNRYFEPAEARTVSVTQQRFEGELHNVPAQLAALYVHSTIGFFMGALDTARVEGARATFATPASAGRHAGVSVLRARFVVTWDAPSPTSAG